MGFCTNVDSVAPDGPVDGTAVARSSSKGGLFGFLRRGNGRLEGPAQTEPIDAKAAAAPSRDGLHSAPGSDAAVASPKPKAERAGLHSAPADRKSAALSLPAENSLSLSEFILERPDGATAAEVDAYLSDILGPKVVKDLRASEWASRVSGVEALQAQLKQPAIAPKGGEQAALFRAGVTVVERLLKDKVVPVYLPALALLEELFSPAMHASHAAVPAKLPLAACDLLAPQLVTRAGSSNVRAREDSAALLLRLARNGAAGGAAIAPHVLRPLSNNKNQHAALGRLELLSGLVASCGVVGANDNGGLVPFAVAASNKLNGNGSGGAVAVEAACDFVTPFCESASDKVREAAMGLLAKLHQLSPEKTLARVSARAPSLAQALTISVGPGMGNGGGGGGMGGMGGGGGGGLAKNGHGVQMLGSSASSARAKLAPLAPKGGPPAFGGSGAALVSDRAAGARAAAAASGEATSPAGNKAWTIELPASTPPVAEARAKARKSSLELGAREPPPQQQRAASKKRLHHGGGGKGGKGGGGSGAMMAAAAGENGGVNGGNGGGNGGNGGGNGTPRTPTPLPGQGPGRARVANSGGMGTSPRRKSSALFDDLDEGLMESILDAEAVPTGLA